MSDTPRTDRVSRITQCATVHRGKIYQGKVESVDASFARELERENAELRKLVEQMREALEACEENICHGVWSDGNDKGPMNKLLDALEAYKKGGK